MSVYHALARPFHRLKPALRRVPGIVPLARGLRYCLDGRYRSEWHLRRAGAPDLFQITGYTAADRYPMLFAGLARALEGRPAPRILSFGCSSGEEIESLRAVLPGASFVGIDINRHSIALARRRLARSGVRLIHAGRVGTAAGGPFDAIVCMAVLQRTELNQQRPLQCARLLPFTKFEAAITEFDHNLKIGGLLLLQHSNFRFSDTAASARYEAAEEIPALRPGTAKYGRDDQLIPEQATERLLYRKLAEAGGAAAEP
jgi:Fe2+ transport system protein FeoA